MPSLPARISPRSRNAATPVADRRENHRRALEAEGLTAEEIAQHLAELDEAEDDRSPHARARRAGIPPLYLGVGFEDIEADEGRAKAILTARNWAKGKTARGLYLWSAGGDEDNTGFGVGKTRIAAAAAQAVLKTGQLNVRWLDVVRLMTDLNLPFGHPTYSQAADNLRRPAAGEVVVLDDIDKQPPTDRNIQPIFALVNDAVNGKVPTIITANRDLDSLASDYGDRFGHALASRLVGHCIDVEVRGPDRRLSAA